VTTLLAPITEQQPMSAPFKIDTRSPIQLPRPIRIGELT
jgi:hypothetical protein